MKVNSEPKIIQASVSPTKLLLFFLIFAFVSVWIIDRYDLTSIDPSTNVGTNSLSQLVDGSEVQEVSLSDQLAFNPEYIAQPTFVNLEDVQGAASVGNIFNPTGASCVGTIELLRHPVCSNTDVSYELGSSAIYSQNPDGSITVRDNINVEPWLITYPSDLFDGTDFEDVVSEYDRQSCINRNISTDNDEYCLQTIGTAYGSKDEAANNPDFSPTLVGLQKFTAPGSGDLFDIDGSMESYSVHICSSKDGQPCDSDSGTIALFKGIGPNGRDTSPAITNGIASSSGVGGIINTPGYKPPSYNINSCQEYSDPDLNYVNNIDIPCITERTSFFEFGAFLTKTTGDLLECAGQDPNNPSKEICRASTVVGIQVDSLLGSEEVCHDEQCGNRLAKNITQIYQIPGTDVPDTVIATKCMVRLNYYLLVDVPCLYPYDTILSEGYMQAAEKAPDKALDPNKYQDAIIKDN